MSDGLVVQINGKPASADAHTVAGWGNYGHFTSMQVRAGRTRGLDFHLARLDAANRELFGKGIDGDEVRQLIRRALGDATSVTARVRAYESGSDVDLMVIVDRPVDMPPRPHRLRSVPYQRPIPHIKHSGGFAQRFYRRQVAADGFDEALLTDPAGAISEGASTNVGWWNGSAVVWPTAPALAGTTQQVLARELTAHGTPQDRQGVRLRDVPTFPLMFLANSWGIAPVNRVDEMDLPIDADAMKLVSGAYNNAPWDHI